MKQKGFTLLEILLVIAAIGILAAIVIVAINPNRQLAQVRNAQRQSDVSTLNSAMEQYLIDNSSYPAGVSASMTEICNSGGNGVGEGGVNTGCLDLRVLVPDYVASIPVDSNHGGSETGYYAWIHAQNNKVSIYNEGELDTQISINIEDSVAQDGLLVHYSALDSNSYLGSGTAVTDLSNISEVGNLRNGASYNGTNPPTFDFDGVNDYVHTNERIRWTPGGIGSNNLTLEFWTQGTDAGGYYLSKPWNGMGEYNYHIRANSIYLRVEGQAFNQAAPLDIADGEWNHIVVVFTPTQIAAYKNGEEVLPFTNHGITTNSHTNDQNLVLALMTYYPYGGGWSGNTSFSIDGSMSQFRAYDRAITPAEVKQNYITHQAVYR